ncbi:Platinum sensitivity protein [Purpureocillium takamizusanense]|uniref:Platinum sensitivity protein n=1 Tax=Purpureocillium takamizusanense TaxID=2060973 RepID=A0A9Q8Q631_9HYPO|nr:Platinum sensitivity protein [Purpureocillium takamizusanense]UNI13452.1 Platinum sensitivity protein [Purpureocillium takamizusanense]
MMAQPVPHQATDKRRVKVYELRNNDWFDRGTGFCTAAWVSTEDGRKEPRVIVESEDQPERILLETKILKEDGFQKQQETLIVWQEPTSGVDMALSFQEADGCAMIWRFVSNIQHALQNNGTIVDDLSDDLAMEAGAAISLPAAELGNLGEIETAMRMMATSPTGRDGLAKAIMAEDYIGKLIPLVEMAEDLESLPDLHRLCNIMKTILLLNDTTIIEHAVSDDCVLGVVGALEYDPDFPSHKANHRHWLDNQGRFKEVVPIEDDQTRQKIHQTYRLQYLKDVVLARILDDPTFSVMNSLIFFNQVDIVQHLQSNSAFLGELFGIFNARRRDSKKRKEAVLFIQQCCAIAKNIQPPARQTLYNNFLAHGLLQVIHFGLRHSDVAVRVGATDIMISIIDHDPHMIRQTIYRQTNDNQPSLTDSLIDLLLVEVDLGVKSQISEALKVLLDQGMPPQGPEQFAKVNGEYVGRARPQATLDPQQEHFLTRFYERSALKLFKPLLDLQERSDMNFSVQQASMFTYLVEILCFFVRQHHRFSKHFVLNNNLAERICQLLQSPEKYLRLVSVRFIRYLVGLQDEFYTKHLTEKRVFGPILDVLIDTLPRDNLVSSSSLELFEHIKKENLKELVKHLVINYRERLVSLSYLVTFRDLVLRYDQTQGFTANMDYYLESEEDITRKPPPNARLLEHVSIEAAEDEYWNTSDPEDEEEEHHGEESVKTLPSNGPVTPSKPLVDYPSDEDSDETGNAEDGEKSTEAPDASAPAETVSPTQEPEAPALVAPPERLSEKRRREEDEEDELGKLMQNKRRSSGSSEPNSSASPRGSSRRNSFSPNSGNGGSKKISISLSTALKTGGDSRSGDDS